jgi:hypothetical protein
MPNIKDRKPHQYRETRQRGRAVNLTVTAPSSLAKLVHIESRLANKSVSHFMRDILADRYKHLVGLNRQAR